MIAIQPVFSNALARVFSCWALVSVLTADQGEKIAGRHLLLELVDDNMAQLAGCSRYCDRHGKYLRVESG